MEIPGGKTPKEEDTKRYLPLLVPRRGFTPQGGINFDSPAAKQQKRKIPKGIFLFCDCPQVLLSVNQRFLSCFSSDVVAPSSRSVTT